MSIARNLRTRLALITAKNLCYRRLLAKLGYVLLLEGMTVQQINKYIKEHNLLTTSPEDKFISISQAFKTKSPQELLETCKRKNNISCFGKKGPDDGTRCLYVYTCDKHLERKKNEGCEKWEYNPH